MQSYPAISWVVPERCVCVCVCGGVIGSQDLKNSGIDHSREAIGPVGSIAS